MCSERVSGLFRREKMLPRKGSSGTMERVYGGRIGCLLPVAERALAGGGGVRRLWLPGLPAVPGGSVPGGFRCGVDRLRRDVSPVAGCGAGRVSCGGRCRCTGYCYRGGTCGSGIPAGGRVLRVGGRRCPDRAASGSVHNPPQRVPADAGRQLPLYNYDSECFIFDTKAESRTDTLSKPDVNFFSVLSL